ncbi:hypothetical protein SeLEV6574_g03968 [Synchytrium endobioticum]|uniref:Uncharacterized protein n=1 Tax=Synchytrium endobioticum TaxID=286115 RepID=A0A507D1P3_9FUNG|nr:hypothetical protein SeLEV6574_g03968 [Synchytrium endobioticum]
MAAATWNNNELVQYIMAGLPTYLREEIKALPESEYDTLHTFIKSLDRIHKVAEARNAVLPAFPHAVEASRGMISHVAMAPHVGSNLRSTWT